jgi:hypothetical protein
VTFRVDLVDERWVARVEPFTVVQEAMTVREERAGLGDRDDRRSVSGLSGEATGVGC